MGPYRAQTRQFGVLVGVGSTSSVRANFRRGEPRPWRNVMTEPADDRPRPRDGLEVSETEDGLLIYDTSAGQVHHLNFTASAVFSLCDGERTTEELATELQNLYRLPSSPIEEAADCIRTMRDQGLLT
jgi:hypothetical protein